MLCIFLFSASRSFLIASSYSIVLVCWEMIAWSDCFSFVKSDYHFDFSISIVYLTFLIYIFSISDSEELSLASFSYFRRDYLV